VIYERQQELSGARCWASSAGTRPESRPRSAAQSEPGVDRLVDFEALDHHVNLGPLPREDPPGLVVALADDALDLLVD